MLMPSHVACLFSAEIIFGLCIYHTNSNMHVHVIKLLWHIVGYHLCSNGKAHVFLHVLEQVHSSLNLALVPLGINNFNCFLSLIIIIFILALHDL